MRRSRAFALLAVCALAALLRLSACAKPCDFAGTTLRKQAKGTGLLIGVAAQDVLIRRNPLSTKIVTKEFALIVPENEFKMAEYYTPSSKPGVGTFNFEKIDRMVEFARRNRQKIRAHTMFYHWSMPHGLTSWRMSQAQWRAWAKGFMCTTMKRYKGKIRDYDIINEAITVASVDGAAEVYDGFYRRTFFSDVLGKDYIQFLFRAAHECDPSAKLYINDFLMEYKNEKTDLYFRLIKQWKKDGVPIHGVGMQGHIGYFHFDQEHIYPANYPRWADIGVELAITELDIMVKCKNDPDHLRSQAVVYRKFMKWALKYKFTSVVIWGSVDTYSWVNNNHLYPCRGAPLLFDDKGKKKPAYREVQQALCDAGGGGGKSRKGKGKGKGSGKDGRRRQRKGPGGSVRIKGADFEVKTVGKEAPNKAWNLQNNGYIATMFELNKHKKLAVDLIPHHAGNEPPKVVILVDNDIVATEFVKTNPTRVVAVMSKALSGPHKVRVKYMNDFMTRNTDRNLIVTQATWKK